MYMIYEISKLQLYCIRMYFDFRALAIKNGRLVIEDGFGANGWHGVHLPKQHFCREHLPNPPVTSVKSGTPALGCSVGFNQLKYIQLVIIIVNFNLICGYRTNPKSRTCGNVHQKIIVYYSKLLCKPQGVLRNPNWPGCFRRPRSCIQKCRLPNWKFGFLRRSKWYEAATPATFTKGNVDFDSRNLYRNKQLYENLPMIA